jgi:hypothetical protein
MQSKNGNTMVFTTSNGDNAERNPENISISNSNNINNRFDLQSVDDDGTSSVKSGGDGSSGIASGSVGTGDDLSTGGSTTTGSTHTKGTTGSGGGLFHRSGVLSATARRDQNLVRCSKCVVLGFMLCAAAAAAATTYVLFSQAQEETFEDEVR